jgi:hypothetical protein
MQDRVKGPAISLIILGSITLAFVLFSILGKGLMLEFGRHMLPPDRFANLEQQMMATGGAITLLGHVLTVCGSGFLIFAGLQMMKLQSHTMVFVASILAMIPCFTSCCCVFGIPIGIWSLLVITKPDVKAAFTS